jgi:hypothetical protein
MYLFVFRSICIYTYPYTYIFEHLLISYIYIRSPYSPSGGVHDGPLVTDNGFWDTFRTVYPMLSVLYPDYLGIIIQGMYLRVHAGI